MKSAILSKVAMCVCPPAIMATSVATIPPLRHAVHRLTTPYHAPAAHAAPRKAFTAAYDCSPAQIVPLTQVGPLAVGQPEVVPTSATRLSDAYDATPTPASLVGTPAFQQASLRGGPALIAPATFPVGTPDTTPTDTGTPNGTPSSDTTSDLGGDSAPSALPETSTWLMMMMGFGFVGAALRGRRSPRFA